MKRIFRYSKRYGLKFVYRLLIYHLKKLLGITVIKHIFISTWYECNANCKHCYEKFKSKNNLSLTTDQVKNIIDKFYNLNGLLVYFCSGEFLMRPDAIELITYARKKSLLVTVVSNGFIIDDNLINKLKECDVTRLIISIDNNDPKKHDLNRGIDGLFNKAIENLKKAKNSGIKTQIWTYLTRSNNYDLQKLVELTRDITSEQIFVFFPLLSGNLFNSFDENFTFEEREVIRKKYKNERKILLEFPDEHSQCRGGGKEHINVTPEGEVTFCPPVPYSYGNIFKEPLKVILKRIKKDYKKFFEHTYTGQCPVNFKEYRENNSGKFIYA